MRNDPIAVGNRRLLKLADLLEALPDERFKFRHWVDTNTYKGKADLSCGTTACAFGWATTIPSLRKLGLRLGAVKEGHMPSPYMLGDNGETTYDAGVYVDNVDRAAKAVFHIGVKDVQLLFLPDEYDNYGGLPIDATRREVAANIRKFVASRARGNGRV